ALGHRRRASAAGAGGDRAREDLHRGDTDVHGRERARAALLRAQRLATRRDAGRAAFRWRADRGVPLLEDAVQQLTLAVVREELTRLVGGSPADRVDLDR